MIGVGTARHKPNGERENYPQHPRAPAIKRWAANWGRIPGEILTKTIQVSGHDRHITSARVGGSQDLDNDKGTAKPRLLMEFRLYNPLARFLLPIEPRGVPIHPKPSPHFFALRRSPSLDYTDPSYV